MAEPALGQEWPKNLFKDGGDVLVWGDLIQTTVAGSLEEEEALRRDGWRLHPLVTPLDGDHDGKMGGSIDAYDHLTDDELRVAIQDRGAAVHHKTGRVRMLQILRGEAA